MPAAKGQMIMKISEMFRNKKALWSFEVFPPKPTADTDAVSRTLGELADLHPDYVSVTCGAGGTGNRRTAEIAGRIRALGIEPLAHLTCINSSAADVETSLAELKAEGITNILALRGDRVPGAKESEDFAHASDLAAFVMARGDFDLGGACYPECHPESASPEEDIENLKKKIDAGVTHLNTQLFYDNEDFYRFADRLAAAGITVPVQAGIMPLVKKSHVDRTIGLSGAKLPGKITRMIARFYDDPESLMAAGIAYATDQITDLLSAGVRGVHLYVMNNPYVARTITGNVSSILASVNR